MTDGGDSSGRVLDPTRIALLALIGSLSVAALVAIAVILGDSDLDETGARAIGSAIAVMLFSLCGLAGGSLRRARPELDSVGTIAQLLAGIGLVLTLVVIWAADDWWDEGVWEATFVALFLNLGLAHCCLLLRRDPAGEGTAGAVRIGTVLLTALLTALAVVEVTGDGEDVGPRALGVVAVLVVLGSILVPLLRALDRGERGA